MVVIDAPPNLVNDTKRKHRLELGAVNLIEEANTDYFARAAYSTLGSSLHVQQVTMINIWPDYAMRLAGRVARDNIAELFYDLAEEWRESTAVMSSIGDITMHRAYQEIIGLGRDAVTLILRELEREPDHWFWALKSITGTDPVPSEDRGNISKMRNAWIVWGQDNDLI